MHFPIHPNNSKKFFCELKTTVLKIKYLIKRLKKRANSKTEVME